MQIGRDQKSDVANLISVWADCWNVHDMERARTLVADDVEFVTVAGLWLRGGDEFLAHHRQIHRNQMRDSRWTSLGYNVNPIDSRLSVVHLEWTIAGDREPDGTPRVRRFGLFTWLTERRDGRSFILVAHNSDLRPGVQHRLSDRCCKDISACGGEP